MDLIQKYTRAGLPIVKEELIGRHGLQLMDETAPYSDTHGKASPHQHWRTLVLDDLRRNNPHLYEHITISSQSETSDHPEQKRLLALSAFNCMLTSYGLLLEQEHCNHLGSHLPRVDVSTIKGESILYAAILQDNKYAMKLLDNSVREENPQHARFLDVLVKTIFASEAHERSTRNMLNFHYHLLNAQGLKDMGRQTPVLAAICGLV